MKYDSPALTELRQKLVDIRKRKDQVIDTITQDRIIAFEPVTGTGAREATEKVRDYIEKHKDEMTELQLSAQSSRPAPAQHFAYDKGFRPHPLP